MKMRSLPLLSALVAALLTAAVVPASAFSTPPQGTGPWVVRACYTSPAQLAALTAWTEPWTVDLDARCVVVDVDQAGHDRLLAAGFQVQVDDELTAGLARPRVALDGQLAGIPGYPCYRTVEETYAAAAALAAAYPDLATWTDVGDSWAKTRDPAAGYDLMVLRLTNAMLHGPKPALFIMASVHAREYTPAELATRFAEYLLAGYGTNADATWLLDYHEVHVLLQANPDGRKIAESGVSWRKNVDSDDGCADAARWGTDLNRNFGFTWHACGDESCSSGDPCNAVYRGPGPASEPEVAAIEAYVHAHFPDQRPDDLVTPAPADATGVFLDLHSAGGWVLWPWGFGGVAPNDTAFYTLGRKFAYYNGYAPYPSVNLYPTDGVTFDFAYGELGIAGLAFELGTDFFQDCATFENTIVPANMPALIYAARVARAPYLTPAGPDVLTLALSPSPARPGDLVTLTAAADDTRYSTRNGTEPSQAIAAAEFYVDVPPWVTTTLPVAYPMAAVDGAFDEQVEELMVTLDTSTLAVGRHTLFLRARDAAGNWGAISAIFVDVSETWTVYLPLTFKVGS